MTWWLKDFHYSLDGLKILSRKIFSHLLLLDLEEI